MYYLYTGQFDKHQKLIPYILTGIKRYENKIPNQELCTIRFILFMSHFAVENYSGALLWLNEILNSSERDVRPDLYRISRLANLILHYEMKNISLLNYLFKANQRYFDSVGESYLFESVFMKYFRKIALSTKKTDNLKYFEKMKEELEIAFLDPYQKFALEYFDFEAWINSKLHNLTFAQALQLSRQV